MFLNIAGEQAIEVYNTFCFDEKEVDDVKVLTNKFEAYCNPKWNITYERHLFNTRVQNVGETIDAYVTELKTEAKQAKNCEFGALCDELIWHRIVVSIRDDAVRSRLLCKTELDLQKTVDIFQASEQSKSHMNAIKKEKKIQLVKKFEAKRTGEQRDNQNKKAKSTIDCKYCGLSHERDKEKSPVRGKTC